MTVSPTARVAHVLQEPADIIGRAAVRRDVPIETPRVPGQVGQQAFVRTGWDPGVLPRLGGRVVVPKGSGRPRKRREKAVVKEKT